jgi:hypothetical protein
VRRFAICLIFILLIVPTTWAIDFYGVGGAGPVFTDGGTTEMGWFAGVNTPVLTKTVEGSEHKLQGIVRAGFSYVSGSSEVQGFKGHIILQRSILCEPVYWTFGIGVGDEYEVREGDDYSDLSLKLETGVTLKGVLGLTVGVDFIPQDEKGDRTFVYGLFDLMP